MPGPRPLFRLGLAAATWLAAAAAPGPTTISSLDLARPFGARSAWRFVATQGPEIDSPIFPGDKEPGELHLCLRKSPSAPCDTALRQVLRTPEKDDIFALPHNLVDARVLRGAQGPLLWVETSSLSSADGGHLTLAQALAYRPALDRFVRVFEYVIGSNNNQDIRFVETGRLKGRVVVIEPTDDAPFGYWVMVHAPGKGGIYRQILKFRSATRYGDGNRLSVIDSEMPNIQKRLGLWKSGQPLPLPAGDCPKPHLMKTELWCD